MFGGCAPRGYDPQIRTRPRFWYSAPTPSQVSSSYVYLFGSYRVDKHTNKQTDDAENMERSSLRYDVGSSQFVAHAAEVIIGASFCNFF